jgi:uncharacterized protein (TIGR00730 family)
MSRSGTEKAYRNASFLDSQPGRPLRILAEYLEPVSRFENYDIEDTIVFMGSARSPSVEEVSSDAADSTIQKERRSEMSKYYEDCRQLAFRLTRWSKSLPGTSRRFAVCSGGGPGIMEAANRGASEAKGVNIGLGISLPQEQANNPFVTRELSLEFHYFFMRKFWFAYLAKAVILFPGGFGTLDEMFEILTLLQTGKIRKHLPVVLFGPSYWNRVINFEALVEYGAIDRSDLELFLTTDSVDEAYEYIVDMLSNYSMEEPGARL